MPNRRGSGGRIPVVERCRGRRSSGEISRGGRNRQGSGRNRLSSFCRRRGCRGSCWSDRNLRREALSMGGVNDHPRVEPQRKGAITQKEMATAVARNFHKRGAQRHKVLASTTIRGTEPMRITRRAALRPSRVPRALLHVLRALRQSMSRITARKTIRRPERLARSRRRDRRRGDGRGGRARRRCEEDLARGRVRRGHLRVFRGQRGYLR